MLDSPFTPLAVPRVGDIPIDVRDEAEKARARGYADGFAEGRAAALDEARQQQAADLEHTERVQATYLEQRGSALAALRASQVALDERLALVSELSAARVEELAIDLATAILRTELSSPARSAAHALRRAVEQIPPDRWIRVTFSEQDWRILRSDADAADTLRDIEVTAAPHVDAGGAVVEIQDGEVDTRIVEALGRAAGALRGVDEHFEVVMP